MNEIIFILDDTTKIVMQLECPIDGIDCCFQEYVNIFLGSRKYLLALDSIRYLMLEFNDLLTKALKIKLKLHKSITKDIGYLWNEKLQGKPGLIYMKLEDRNYWVGLNNLLWSTRDTMNPQLDTWIYNDHVENIILEITPAYPWHFSDLEEAEKDINYLPYEEWIKSYKPLLATTIPKDVAHTWLEQSNNILKIIDENVKRLEAE